MEIDGVVKFEADHHPRALPPRPYEGLAGALLAWRDVLVRLGGLGQDPQRYGGAGFGNLSARVGPFPGPRGGRAFLITGTQTGGRRCVALQDLCVVRRYDARRNWVESEGAVRPSSESLTHGAVYDLSPAIRCVLHVHAPLLWRRAAALGLPATPASAAYGTADMAHAVTHLANAGMSTRSALFAMGGHEDGVIAFGPSLDAAGAALVQATAHASALAYAERHQICLD